MLVVKVILLLTARRAPNKIEKQYIANDTFIFVISCNLHGICELRAAGIAGPAGILKQRVPELYPVRRDAAVVILLQCNGIEEVPVALTCRVTR